MLRPWYVLALACLVSLSSSALASDAAPLRCWEVPQPVVDEATGASYVVIASNWRQLEPFASRLQTVPTRARHVIDLAAVRFATDNLVAGWGTGRRFSDPDLSSFPPGLIGRAFTNGDHDLFLVQAVGPEAQLSLRNALTAADIAIVGYVPHDAYLLRLNQAQLTALTANPDVFWIGLYHPAFRIEPKLEYIAISDGERDLKLRATFALADYETAQELRDALPAAAEMSVLDITQSGDEWIVSFAGKARAVYVLATLAGARWIERFVDFELYNNVARTSSNVTTGRGSQAGPVMDVEDVWARGIRGEGQIASAADTGLSTGNLATLHQDFGQQGSATNPMRVLKGYDLGLRGTWDDNQTTGGGHGTHTSGSIVGNGFRSGSAPSSNTFPSTCFAGAAPKAQFVFQSVMDSDGNLGGIPLDLNALFQPPYDDGARVHSNSWGAAVAGAYNTDSQNLDEFVWNNQDMVITFSAGNSGVDTANTSGVIDTDSIGSPGTAKNCITVGATENYRPDFVYEYPSGDCTGNGFTQQAWGWFNGTNFGRAPIYADLMADNANGMGAFSSRGPTNDGRIKPEISAPGIAIVSTRTDLNQAYEQWGICNVPAAQRPYYLTMGGTSMANPLTAGTAVLVRQYYVDGWHANNSLTTNQAAVPADGFNPSAALVKATLINGAWDMYPGQYGTTTPQPEIPPDWDRSASRDLPNNAEGFGRVDLERSLFPGSGWGDDANRSMEVHDVSPGLQTGQLTDYSFLVSSAANPFIATLVWSDPYSLTLTGTTLVNNLDLEVYAPGGTRYYPNRKNWTGGTQDALNNVEQVYVSDPTLGTWTVRVRGTSVPGNGQSGTTTQPYALVMSAVSCVAPAAPTGVTATANGNNRIDVSWTTVPNAAEYRVYRAIAPGGPYTLSATVAAPTVMVIDTDVAGGITYYYVVRSVGSGLNGCESSNSSEASATATGSCDLPTSFAGIASATASTTAACTIDLTWDAASAWCGGPVSYNVYRYPGSTFTPDVSNRIATGITGTAYSDSSGFAASTTYWYVVRAVDTSNGVEDENVVTASATPTGTTSDGTWTAGAEAGDPTMSTNGSWSVSSAREHGGTYSYFSGYSNSLCAYVRTPDLTLTGGQTSVLTYWTAWDIENAYDGGVVDISTNAGSTWTRLTPTPGYPGSFNRFSGDACGYNRDACYTGTGNLTFQQYTVSLGSYAGQTVRIRWNFSTDTSLTGEGWYVDDVAITHVQTLGSCGGTPLDVEHLTVTSKATGCTVEWMNPPNLPVSYGATRINARTDTYPTAPADSPLATQAGTAGLHDAYTHTPASGVTEHYRAYVNSAANGSGVWSGPGLTTRSAPHGSISDPIKWSFSTGATSLASPRRGFNFSGVYVASNDRRLYAMQPGASGGLWPSGWTPAPMNAPAQMPPSLLQVGSSFYAFAGATDHRVYAFDAATGDELWTSADLGGMVVANPMLMHTDHGGLADLVIVGTRNASAGNRLCALDMADGTTAWCFDNRLGQGGDSQGIGIISGPAFVDAAWTSATYPGWKRAFFASRGAGAGSPATLWCVRFTASQVQRMWAVNAGDSDGAVTSNWVTGPLLVGTNAGEVKIVDPDSGAVLQSRAFGDGAVKEHVVYDSQRDRLVFSTESKVWSVPFDLTDTTDDWSVALTSPSRPTWRTSTPYVYVGACADAGCTDGKLVQLDSGAAWSPASTASVTLAQASWLGGATIDDFTAPPVAHVGSASGRVYTIKLPLVP